MQPIKRGGGMLATAILLISLSSAVVHAQGPDGGPPPPMGPGGPPAPRASAATIPISTLTTELTLSSDQQAKISTIQETFQDARRALIPVPPRPSDDGGQDAGPPPSPPQPPDASTRDKVRALESDASKKVEDVLTASQKTLLASLIQTMRALQAAGISPRAYDKLALTSDQKTQIVAAATAQRAKDKTAIEKAAGDPEALQSILGDSRRQLHDAVLAILTDTQKSIARSAGPRGPRGGPGGYGGPGDGSRDGQGPPPMLGDPGDS